MSSIIIPQVVEGKLLSLYDFLQKYGGATIKNGLFRIHSCSSSIYWTKVVTNFFKNYQNAAHCFGFDWLGRHFATNIQRNIIYIFDPATYECLQLEESIDGFFNIDLTDYIDSTLATDDFAVFLNSNGINSLGFNQCVGFKIPLFLGGNDSQENYELIDMDVYWEICRQVCFSINEIQKE